jgi:chemotaxis protein CheZ
MSAADNVDLEALFDEVAAQRVAEQSAPPAPAPTTPAAGSRSESADDPEMFERVGRLTRNLHTALHDLGYDKTVEKLVDASSDTRTRLSYISDLTRQAAERVLGAIEAAKPVQQEIGAKARTLQAQWQDVFAGRSDVGRFKDLAHATVQFLESAATGSKATEEHLLNIMMAQDFHDLTGQVIKRIVALAQDLEEELVEFLIEARPRDASAAPGDDSFGLSGPVVSAQGRSDVVTSQQQVDDLLAELGF